MTDIFEKAAKAAKDVGDTVVSSAKSLGGSLYNSTKEQSELAGLNVQKSVLDKKLNDSYAEIGKRYVDYMERCSSTETFDVSDIIEKIKPDLDKLADLKVQIEAKREQIKEQDDERFAKKAQADYDFDKEKLDKALSMEIINEEEYNEKLDFAKRKLDNYMILRKIEAQLEMDIISKEEYNEKRKNILGR